MIDIRPDPRRPRGGFAEITIEGADPVDGPVEVSIYNSYQQKWLGPDGWQPGQVGIPARQADWADGLLRLVVGPDIVNQIEEDTPVRIVIGAGSWDTYWPDDINHGPDVAIEGDLGGTGTGTAPKAPTPVTRLPDPTPPPAPTPPDEDETPQEPVAELPDPKPEPIEDDGPVIEDDEDDTEKKKTSMALWLVALLLVAAAGAAYYFTQMAPETVTEDTTDTSPEPERTATADNACASGALDTLAGQGFTALADQLRNCTGDVSADAALTYVERAAGAEDPAALSLFGALYDETVTDDAIEGTIGLTFGDDPARAAEYYFRAQAAGSEDAAGRLAGVCRRLLLLSDTLSQSAHDDYCT